MKWETVSVGEVTNHLKGFAFKSSHYVQHGVPVVRVSDFTEDSISMQEVKYYPMSLRDNYVKYMLETGDILIQTVGSWQNNPLSVVGKVVTVPEELNGALLNQNIVKLFPAEKIDGRFLFYRLKCSDFFGHNIGNATGAANQASITLNTINSFKFDIPKFPTQRCIAKILSAYDDLIENNQRQINLLEEAAMLLYKEWFVKLRFPGHENVKVVDGVPEGWSKGSLQELIDVKYGKDHKKLLNGDMPVYGSGGIMRRVNKSLYAGESVLIPRKGSLNNIMFINEEFWTVDTMFYSIPKRAFIMPYVYLYLKGWDMYAMNTGAAVPSTTTETLNSMQISIPSEYLLAKFDKAAQNYFSCANALKRQINQARAARDKLLPKLMNGEII